MQDSQGAGYLDQSTNTWENKCLHTVGLIKLSDRLSSDTEDSKSSALTNSEPMLNSDSEALKSHRQSLIDYPRGSLLLFGQGKPVPLTALLLGLARISSQRFFFRFPERYLGVT